jgi:alpha-D-ribose 1-methylphosphonate 5-triphosphate synthase subunit PhnH
MKAPALHNMVPGFHDPSLGSQAVFRVALQALSHPGLPLNMPLDTALPTQGHGAAAALLLGLLDADTTLWLSPSLADGDAAAWLRFHTGCQRVDQPESAQFLWLARGDAWPALAALQQGSDEYPDESATCVIEVQALNDHGPGWLLQGPGILGQRSLRADGMHQDFQAQWAASHAQFPRGVDVFLATPTQVVGLPRTTRILNSAEV